MGESNLQSVCMSLPCNDIKVSLCGTHLSTEVKLSHACDSPVMLKALKLVCIRVKRISCSITSKHLLNN